MYYDTIAAIASGLTRSGIGIIRISGPEAVTVADRVLTLSKPLSGAPTHTIHYGFVKDPERNGERVDEVLAMLMRAPRSYTGDDVVEIQCHGGPFIMKKILKVVLGQGARLAEPGEFTKAAFLNGRLDLSQAEAVMDLIGSENEFARRASLDQLRGSIGTEIRDIRGMLLYQTAYLEAAMDDPEHMSTEGFSEKLRGLIEPAMDRIDEMLRRSEDGKILVDGIRTAIVGAPNVGKSSLLNLLLGEERAIVTNIPGTTRDVLEETMRLQGITLKLADTAGIRKTEDLVERIGVDRAEQKAETADLILYVIDGSKAETEEPEQIRRILSGHKALILLNKSDLGLQIDAKALSKEIGVPVIEFSAVSGSGKERLEREILHMFHFAQENSDGSLTIANLRQQEELKKAYASLALVKEAIELGLPEDLFTIDLMDAYEALGRIIGEAVSEDLTNEIFASFCMGK